MKKNLLLLLITAMLISGCSENNDFQSNESIVISSKSASEKIANAEIVKELIDSEDFLLLTKLRNDCLDRMKKANKTKLKLAIETLDDEQVCMLLGYTQADVLSILDQLQNAANNLIENYPEVKQWLAESKQCKKCDLNLSSSFEILNQNYFSDPIQYAYMDPTVPAVDPEDDGGGCYDSGGFVGCCIACAVAPVTVWAYPACVAFCYVVFC